MGEKRTGSQSCKFKKKQLYYILCTERLHILDDVIVSNENVIVDSGLIG